MLNTFASIWLCVVMAHIPKQTLDESVALGFFFHFSFHFILDFDTSVPQHDVKCTCNSRRCDACTLSTAPPKNLKYIHVILSLFYNCIKAMKYWLHIPWIFGFVCNVRFVWDRERVSVRMRVFIKNQWAESERHKPRITVKSSASN